MDVCSGYLKMVRNSAIIIDKLFETICYFPESFSNHEVQSYMQRNSHRTFPSLHKCIVSLNQQNQNVVFVNTKCAYAMEETDCLVKILLDLSNKYKNVIDIEYDAVKNCLQYKNTLENGQEDVSVKHTDNFESMVDSGNTICQNQEKKNTMQKRQKVLKTRSKNKDVSFLLTHNILAIPIFRIHASSRDYLMPVVNSSKDPYSLCEENVSLGEIVYDDEGPASAVPQPQPSHHTNTRNVALPNTTVINDNPAQGRRLEESSNSESVPSSIPSAHEQHGTQHTFISRGRMSGSEHVNVLNNVSNDNSTQGRRLEESSNSESVPSSIHAHEEHGNQQNFILNEEATDGTSVPAFTAEDRIICPRYLAYTARLSTFTKWPSDLTQKPEHVAQAGFYYTGLQDVVRCFACDGGLKNWDPEDDPWIEHARWFPLCPFVQKVKGQEFVKRVQIMTAEIDEEEDAVVHSTFQGNHLMAHPPDLQQLNLRNETDEPSQPNTDAAQSVLQTGYSKRTVAIAVQELIRKDKRTILRENEYLKSIVRCMKCKVRTKNTLFLPCTHHCLCDDCAEKCSLCPECYQIINKKIKTVMI